MMAAYSLIFKGLALFLTIQQVAWATEYNEPHRNQFHFSQKSGWMNDPNGLVFHEGVYHLYYQHDPTKTTTGNLHWGHATSSDLVHWEEQPVALYPDHLGLIFSGSAVVDTNNSAGFAAGGKVPIVAIFTSHNDTSSVTLPEAQSLAYSLDNGKTFTKYAGNPVLTSPGPRDFRDPKVFWYAPQNKWVMSLAVVDHISFYSSTDLKNWKHESDFGALGSTEFGDATIGAHGGVWECPDLFPLLNKDNRTTIWVLLVSINPGGPNGGSAVQYFPGQFDGVTFKAFSPETFWLDYGTDNYAGVTFFNTGDRRILIGWMSNWNYGQVVPTEKWRSAMTIPRELGVRERQNGVGGDLLENYLTMQPVAEFTKFVTDNSPYQHVLGPDYFATHKTNESFELSLPSGSAQIRLDITTRNVGNFRIEFTSGVGDKLVVGYQQETDQYFIDRSQAGNASFSPGFSIVQKGYRINRGAALQLTLIADVASVELFADGGLTCMTAIFFPNAPLKFIQLIAPSPLLLTEVKVAEIPSIWTAKENHAVENGGKWLLLLLGAMILFFRSV